MPSRPLFEPLSPPVRALAANLAAGYDIGEVVAHWLCELAAACGGIHRVTANRPGSWEAAHIRALMTGTAGELGEELAPFMPKLTPDTEEEAPATGEAEYVQWACPKCDAAGRLPYLGRSGETNLVACGVCEGSGSLAGLLAAARGEEAGQRVMVRLAAAVEAYAAATDTPPGMVRLVVDVHGYVADALAHMDAEAGHRAADPTRAAGFAIRKLMRDTEYERRNRADGIT